MFTKYFKFYHQTTINPIKINEVKTVPGYKDELMRPSIGIANYTKDFHSMFWS